MLQLLVMILIELARAQRIVISSTIVVINLEKLEIARDVIIAASKTVVMSVESLALRKKYLVFAIIIAEK